MSNPAQSRKSEISALDLRLLADEWKLAGTFIRKIYQSTGDRQPKAVKPGREWKLVFEVFIPQKGTNYLHVFPAYITLSKQKGNTDETPSGFCMSLRKHLSGKRIERLEQHRFDRILEIYAGGLRLILEFVPPGNVILADPEGMIISALSTKRWKDREIRVRSLYHYPQERPDPFSMDLEKFGNHFRQDRKAAAILASELGFGSEYANKLCSEAGVRPDKNGRSLTEAELKSLFERMRSLARIQKEEPFTETMDRQKERLERIERQRAEAREKWKAAEKLSKERADAIYRKFDTVQALLEKFSSKKEVGFEPIQKKEGFHITVNLDGVDVPLDLKKTAQDNAAFYYEQAKKARRKLAGLEASMQKPLGMRQEEPQEYPDKEMHKEWFRKFKWFLSSDGILVIAGKNAEQNELILKNHAEPDEWCFHADIKGAAFTVIKSGSAEPLEQTKKEAAEFAAANSKAWTKGLGAVTVFSVQRKGLSKSAPTGMNLPKGSFMVSGQRVWYKSLPLRMAVGADPEGMIISGSESAVKKSCRYVVILVPGGKKASDLSRDMKSELLKNAGPKDLPVLQKLSLDELARHVPFGKGEISAR